MSKNTRRNTAQPSPSSEQIAAVRRLAEKGDIQQARRRLAALRKSFPGFKPLFGLAWEVEDLGDEPSRATARALEWQQASPNNRAAVEAVFQSAHQAGLFMLNARAADRLCEMDGKKGLAPANIDNPLGKLTPEQALAMDLARMHLDDGNTAASIAALEGVDHPSAKNNLALALFVDGQVPQAQALVEANWLAEPNNLFALDCAVRWRCWLKGMDHCMGLKAPLQHTAPLRSEDAVSQVLALRFLGDEEAAAQAWAKADRATFWSLAAQNQRSTFIALRDPWADWPGSTAMWFPRTWLETHSKRLAALPNLSEHLLAQCDEAFAAVCNAHTDYLVRVVDVGDEASQYLAFAVLKERAKNQRDAVREALVALLKSPAGDDSQRTTLLRWMVEEGLLDKNKPVDVWVRGEVQSIRSTGWKITGEGRPSPFPPEGTELNARALTVLGEGRMQLALELMTQLHRMYPDKPSPLGNIASIKEALKHDPGEIKAIYQQAHALDPNYLFAVCGLVRSLAQEGQLEEARELLAPIAERDEFHCSEARIFLITQQVLALAEGDHALAHQLDASIDALLKEYW